MGEPELDPMGVGTTGTLPTPEGPCGIPATAPGTALGPCAGVDLALTRVFILLGKRWSGLVVAVLSHGPAHFSQLRRAIPGISERMLSDRLTELAEAGLVVRRVDEGPPLRVSYQLTEAGRALRPALDELRSWAATHLPEPTPPGC
ncbi:helix-turn-helix transcriptional regulator [Kitasatospora sp. NBC_01287]|uniref:winged helix-turn-helix transcriptional regulator n=1 Tax=Kitasatospora sp. NBC_01287 TaxID=2903573 RepID=UPI002258A696|nr:helix-turn-helix domain-containing protein [Kitasatospora sp. NBC_01287]MCX4747630.1 helix-turn-helix transcriptional regulator [Kitasatospora sp. NBC_01287]